MKLVALRSFHNTPKFGIKVDEKTPNFQHPLEVPKGHRFTLGGDAKTLKGVANDGDRELIGQLIASRAVIVDDESPETKDLLTALDKEVAAEAKIRNVKPAAQEAPDKNEKGDKK